MKFTESTVSTQLHSSASTIQHSHSFQLHSNLMEVSLINDDLFIEVMSLQSEKFYYSQQTYQSLSKIDKNIIKDFESLQSILEEFILSAREGKLEVDDEKIIMKYEIQRRKNSQPICRQLLFPVQQIALSQAQYKTKVIKTLKDRVINLIHEKNQKQLQQDKSDNLMYKTNPNMMLKKQLENQKRVANKQKFTVNDKFQDIEKDLTAKNSKIHSNITEMQTNFAEIFYDKKESTKEGIPNSQNSQKSSLISEVKGISERKGRRFLFKIDKKHKSYNKFYLHGNEIVRNYSNRIGFLKIVSEEGIPKHGRHYFDVKLINPSINHGIVYGIVEESMKDKSAASGGKEEIYYYNFTPFIRSNTVVIKVEKRLEAGEVLTMIIDNDEHQVHWLVEEKEIGSCRIDKTLWSKQMYAYVGMYYPEASIEIINGN